MIPIYFKGCQAQGVAQTWGCELGGSLNPDLNIVATKIRQAFNAKQLDLAKLQSQFPEDTFIVLSKVPLEPFTVEQIALEGFSRGAVTTYAVAKKLNDLEIDMHIIANQPVPGDSFIGRRNPYSLTKQYGDLSKCQFVKSATTILGSYAKDNSYVENLFFQQMKAQFHQDTQEDTLLIPCQNHWDSWSSNIVPLHIKRKYCELGYGTQADLDAVKLELKQAYQEKKFFFTPPDLSQKIYGINDNLTQSYKDPLYLEAIRECAKQAYETAFQLVNKTSTLPPEVANMSNEQAEAIMSLFNVKFHYGSGNKYLHRKSIYDLMLKSSDNGKKFCAVANKIAGICNHLKYQAKLPKEDAHSNELEAAINSYQSAVLGTCYDYLEQKNPNKDQFILAIQNTERTLREAYLKGNRDHRIIHYLHYVAVFAIACTLIGIYLLYSNYNWFSSRLLYIPELSKVNEFKAEISDLVSESKHETPGDVSEYRDEKEHSNAPTSPLINKTSK